MAEKNSFRVQSVLQKNRMKSAVLYSPEACEEEEMVHTASTSNDIDTMELAQSKNQYS